MSTADWSTIHGVRFSQKKSVFIIVGNDLARSPETLKELGGKSSQKYTRWSFLNEKKDEVTAWLSSIEEGQLEHDHEKPVPVPKAPVVTKEIDTGDGVEVLTVVHPVVRRVRAVQPRKGQSILVTLSNEDKSRPKETFFRKITSVQKSKFGFIFRASYEEPSTVLKAFGGGSLVLVGNYWEVEGLGVPHKVSFLTNKAEEIESGSSEGDEER